MSDDLPTLLQRVRRLRDRSQYLSAEADRVNREADKLLRLFSRPPSRQPQKADGKLED